MEYAEFRRRVRDRAGLDTDESTAEAIAATLITLSERVPDADAQDLAEQLPDEVGEHLTAADSAGAFGYDEFRTRVAEREAADPDPEAAAIHAQAVVAVLLEAVSGRESDDLLSSLTADYEPLFGMVDPESVWGPGWRDRLGQHG